MNRLLPKIILRFLLLSCCWLTGCSLVAPLFSSTERGAPGANIAPTQPGQHIALLLPLQGSVGNSAQAIRNGFLAAYYYNKSQNGNAPTVTVLDTSSNNVVSVYQQAIASGANVVVGPLTKPQVATLASSSAVQVPTLALNTIDSSTPSNFYQFGLSPRDEADQAAQKAAQDGHHSVIIIAPANAWGQNIANAFANRWRSQGDQIVDTLAFSSRGDLTNDLRNLMHVDKDIVSSKGFKKAQEEKIPLSEMRRQDFDVIFLVATPQQARLIKPLLKFYFAGNVPVYATSSIYSGTPSPDIDRDLDGIIFCDMPWVLEGSSQLPDGLSSIKARSAALWPNSYASYSKLYAFGADAYNLSTNLNRLSSGYSGATGTLYLGQNRVIYRRLQWAQMRNGVPVPL